MNLFSSIWTDCNAANENVLSFADPGEDPGDDPGKDPGEDPSEVSG